jgi:hypothetical protein
MASLDRPPEAETEQVTDPGGAGYAATLAGLLRGQRYAVDLVFRVAAVPGSRAVEVRTRKRSDDGGRWWLSWGGGVWMCEADHPHDALVQIKGALRRVGA